MPFASDSGQPIRPVREYPAGSSVDVSGVPLLPLALDAPGQFAADGRPILPIAEIAGAGLDAADGQRVRGVVFYDPGTLFAPDGRACRPAARYDYATGAPEALDDLLLSGDMTDGNDHLLLSGDMQGGVSDVLQLSGSF